MKRLISLLLIAYSGFFLSQAIVAETTYIIKVRPELQMASRSLESDIQKISPSTKVDTLKLKSKLSIQSDPTLFVAKVENQKEFDKKVKQLQRISNIEYIEPVYPIELFEVPNEPDLSEQTYLTNTSLSQLFSFEGSHTVKVAVVDSGVDYQHKDLKEQIALNDEEAIFPNSFILENPHGSDDKIDADQNGLVDDVIGYNFYGNGNTDPMDVVGHGTHIAGLIAANPSNQEGITSLGNQTKIIPIAFLSDEGLGNQLDASEAIYYAVSRGAKVINCSWGFTKLNTVLEEAVQYALDNNVVVVAAMGNSGSVIKEYPAAIPGVIAVGSVGLDQERSHFSSIGSHMVISMYGESIYSALPKNGYGFKSGTSQATALVSSIIAKILSINPNLSPTDIKILLENSSTNPSGTFSSTLGYGILNGNTLAGYLEQMQNGVDVIAMINNSFEENPTASKSSKKSISNVMNFPNPFKQNTQIYFKSDTAGSYTIKIFNKVGRVITNIVGQSLSTETSVFWDGKDESGNVIENGTYFYHLALTTDTGTHTSIGKLTKLQ